MSPCNVGDYNYSALAAAAGKAHVNPVTAMVHFISRIGATFRKINPAGYVLSLNAEDLARVDPAFVGDVDGMAFEDTWYSDTPNSPWGDPAGGDIDTDAQKNPSHLQKFIA